MNLHTFCSMEDMATKFQSKINVNKTGKKQVTLLMMAP